MRRIALCLALLATVTACGTSPSASDTLAPGDARFDGSQMGTGSRTPIPPADTTGLGIGTMGNGN